MKKEIQIILKEHKYIYTLVNEDKGYYIQEFYEYYPSCNRWLNLSIGKEYYTIDVICEFITNMVKSEDIKEINIKSEVVE